MYFNSHGFLQRCYTTIVVIPYVIICLNRSTTWGPVVVDVDDNDKVLLIFFSVV